MSNMKFSLLQEFVEKLDTALELYNKNEEDHIQLVNTIKEVIGVVSKENNKIDEDLWFNNNFLYSDGRVLLHRLRILLEEAKENKDSSEKDNVELFWVSYKTWFLDVLPSTDMLKPCYVHYDNWAGGTYSNLIDFSYQYKLHYGIEKSSEEISNDFSIENIRKFIELSFSSWILPKHRYMFTIEVNKKLEVFKIPYCLKSGKLIKQGNRTSFDSKTILNYEMFERKISFADRTILDNGLLEKKSALDAVVDALQYFISIQDGRNLKDKYKKCAKSVSNGEANKTYHLIYREIDEIMKISNDSFDIRHNEYLCSNKEKREPLNDSIFIEYLFNRVRTLLDILKAKHHK